MNHLHSIYFHQNQSNVLDMPLRISRNLDSFRDCHPKMLHQLYSIDLAREFITKYFDHSVLHAFESLRPLAYKADLFRYCLLYQLGGIYADLSLHFYRPVISHNSHSRIVVFRDVASRAPWILSNSLIASHPYMPVFMACIEKIVAHVAKDYYGVTPLCPTGPNLFGAQLALSSGLEEISSGEVIRISRDGGNSYGYLQENGEVIAVAVKDGGGLSSLGVSNAENYNDLYYRRYIYKKNTHQRVWTFLELASRGWISGQEGEGRFAAGIIIFGPYVTLDPGFYRASFIISKMDFAAIGESGISLDFCTNFGKRTIPTTNTTIEALKDNQFEIFTTFELNEIAEKVEVRMHLIKPAKVHVLRLEISDIH